MGNIRFNTTLIAGITFAALTNLACTPTFRKAITDNATSNAASDSPASTPTLDLSLQFESPSGWRDSSDSPINISITLGGGLTPSTQLRCRTGPAATISTQDYTDCTGATQILPSAPGAQDSGTFRTEIIALDESEATIASAVKDYYIHPSLDNPIPCTHSMTDEEFYSAAGVYLDQSQVFDDDSTLSGPFVNIKTNSGGTEHQPITLRKKFTQNSAKTLMILKRRFASQSGTCSVSAAVKTSMIKIIANKTVDALADSNIHDYEAKVYRTTIDTSITTGIIPKLRTQTGGTSSGTGGTWWNRLVSRFSETISDAVVKTKQSKLNTVFCDAIVFNAQFDGICFEADTARIFRTNHLSQSLNRPIIATSQYRRKMDDPDNYPDDGRIYLRQSGGSKRMFSPKFLKSTETAAFNQFVTQWGGTTLSTIEAGHSGATSVNNLSIKPEFAPAPTGTSINAYLLED